MTTSTEPKRLYSAFCREQAKAARLFEQAERVNAASADVRPDALNADVTGYRTHEAFRAEATKRAESYAKTAEGYEEQAVHWAATERRDAAKVLGYARGVLDELAGGGGGGGGGDHEERRDLGDDEKGEAP